VPRGTRVGRASDPRPPDSTARCRESFECYDVHYHPRIELVLAGWIMRYIFKRDLILVLHHENKYTTTPYMRVSPSVWDSFSCEVLLYSCCIGVVNLTFSFLKY